MKIHPLKTWINKRTTQAAFAREVKCSEPFLSEVLTGKKQPSLETAARWSRATGGNVPIKAFLREH